MNEIVYHIAKSLDNSPRYIDTKKFIKDILYDERNPYKKYFDLFIIFLIISSVFILIYGVKHHVAKWVDDYDIYFVSSVFLMEYLLRLWVLNDTRLLIIKEYREADYLNIEFSAWSAIKKSFLEKFSYMLTPVALIDLLAIFPAYRPLGILRLFVLFRVFKLLKYSKNITQFTEVLAAKRFELLTLIALLAFVVTTAGIALYVLEEQINPNITSLFDALYLALVTMSTVGYGDISPVTNEGKVIAMVSIISGLGLISFVTSVIVTAFSEKLIELKENRIVEQIQKSKQFLIICGYGQLTKMFLRQEESKEYNYIILDKNQEKVDLAIADGHNTIKADASRHEVLDKLVLKEYDVTILCLTNSDIENIYITLGAKIVDPTVEVIARANDEALYDKFVRAGADHILMPNSVANTMLISAITQPTIYKAVDSILTSKNIAKIDEMILYEGNNLINQRVEDIDFKSYKLLLIGIQRGKETPFMLNPEDDVIFEKNDVIILMGRSMSHKHFANIYYGSKR